MLTIYETNLIKEKLLSDELLLLELKQSQLRFKIAPTLFAITTKRVIIMRRTPLDLKNIIDYIPFKDISSVMSKNGYLMSSLILRIFGASEETDKDGIIDGLNKDEALTAERIINEKILEKDNPQTN